MQLKWKELFVKTLIWLTVEFLLSIVGLDDLADYSEFVNRVDLGCLDFRVTDT